MKASLCQVCVEGCCSLIKDSLSVIAGEDRTSLEEKKSNITMELLWIQQAIDSRKQVQ